MKLFPISDIHPGLFHPTQKWWRTEFAFLNDINVMAIAGDGGEAMTNLVMLAQILLEFPNLHIVYVPGNHDYYGMHYDEVVTELIWADYSIDRLHILTGYDYSTWTYKDFVFIGGTLWTDFNKAKPLVMNTIQKEMHDYENILSGKNNKPVTTTRILQEHYIQKKNIFKNLNKFPNKRRIVVTHHKPYLKEAITEAYTYGYEVDLSKELNECQNLPEIWIFGHTHQSSWKEINYTNGNVLFVSNQFGYPKELSTGFHKDCVLEL